MACNLGAGAVAEMTGRRGRVVADARGRGVYELRAKPDSTEMDSLNVSETGDYCAELSQSPRLQSAAPTHVSLLLQPCTSVQHFTCETDCRLPESLSVQR